MLPPNSQLANPAFQYCLRVSTVFFEVQIGSLSDYTHLQELVCGVQFSSVTLNFLPPEVILKGDRETSYVLKLNSTKISEFHGLFTH